MIRILHTLRLKRVWLLAIPVMLAFWSGVSTMWAAGNGTLVFFHANWCASCREVLPIVQEIAGQNNLTVLQIDVDNQNAPQQARNFGLSIPSDEPPQVYCMNHGRATLIYNGKSYRSGGSGSARATILQNLQQVLTPQK